MRLQDIDLERDFPELFALHRDYPDALVPGLVERLAEDARRPQRELDLEAQLRNGQWERHARLLAEHIERLEQLIEGLTARVAVLERG